MVMKFEGIYPIIIELGSPYYDLTGQSFGRLKVVHRAIRKRNRSGVHSYWWKCQCICGNFTFATRDALLRGVKQSCGCLHKTPQNRHVNCPLFRALVIDIRLNTTKSTADIGRLFGVTKNRVIGILDRAGMIGNPETEPTTMEDRLGQYTFPTTRQCAYPNGVPWEKGFSWCLNPVKPESSCCHEHHAACYIDESKVQRRSSIETADFTLTRGEQSGKPASVSEPATADEAA